MTHYKSHPSGIEAIEITQFESFLRGNVIKYIMRAPYKGSELEDLKKAAEYLQWEIERVQEEQYLKRERVKDLLTRESVFVDDDDTVRDRLIELGKMRREWDDLMFPDKCQECDGDCQVC